MVAGAADHLDAEEEVRLAEIRMPRTLPGVQRAAQGEAVEAAGGNPRAARMPRIKIKPVPEAVFRKLT
jgi:hypothetical protein